MKKMHIMDMPYVVQWKSRSEWTTAACFLERDDAIDFMREQEHKFPEDEFRIERFTVFIGDE